MGANEIVEFPIAEVIMAQNTIHVEYNNNHNKYMVNWNGKKWEGGEGNLTSLRDVLIGTWHLHPCVEFLSEHISMNGHNR